ncbi:MAG: hypothetical protein LLF81_11595 [Porphyromonadaceae bacterium]|nr:hypothetical protein [Porphyromonadaceae bacterium]
MKRIHLLLKVLIVLALFHGLVSCNSEDRKIKKALKENALTDGTKYKLTEYRIIETILKTNLEDSITSGNISIRTQKEMMKMDSLMLKKYIGEREQCIIQKQNTLRYLASTYDGLIEDWQEMIDEQEEKLNEKQEEIDKIKDKVKSWESLIQNSYSPVIYYIIKHQYVLDEKHIERKVLLTTDFQIL